MRYRQILTEAGDAPLYHGTPARRAAAIIRTDAIEPRTAHRIAGRRVAGVSTSRSLGYARHWGRVEAGTGSVVVFRLDGRRLAQDFRILPHDTYAAADWFPELHRYEAEEFVVGRIAPLARYLSGIIVDRQTWTRLRRARGALARHPLLTVIDQVPFSARRPDTLV